MPPHLPLPDLAVVACADLDCDALGWLGLAPGEVHLLTNAGGVVTDDALSDLAGARRALGVSRIVVVQHRPCALMDAHGPGREPPGAVDHLRASLSRLTRAPLCLPADTIHGGLGGGQMLTHVHLSG